MKVWKRNAVISSIVLFVCVALYLSWTYGRDSEGGEQVFDPAASQYGDADAQSPDPADPADADENDGSQEAFTNYFTEARLARKLARDSALSILGQAAGTVEASQAVLDNVTMEIEKLASSAMCEANIEMLVRAKGFAECVAVINDDGIKVMVAEPIGGLTAEDVAKIRDIVLSESSLTVADINIVPVAV